MRSLSWLLLSVAFILAGCSAAPQAPPALEPAPAGPSGAGFDPVVVGRQHLEDGGSLRWLEPPTPVLVQQMSHAEAAQLIPALNTEYPADQPLTPDTRVWLVIFRGRWQLLPYGQTQGTPQPTIYDGCLLTLFAASDGSRIAGGDTLCPPQR